MRFVELEEARAARGLRLIVAGGFPSPWSQAAMNLFDLKEIEYLAVRFRPVAEEVRRWTGSHNVPVVLHDDEPPRTGWAEILELAERLGGSRGLVPEDDAARVRTFGLGHEILGEGGLCWSVRLLLTHKSLTTNGREGWPASVGAYLAPKYGYAPERVTAARDRACAVLRLLGRSLDEARARGHAFFFGDQPTALDVYAAVGIGPIAPLPHQECPMLAPVRQAFDSVDPEVRAAVPASLLAHRRQMFDRHLPLPVRF